MFHMRFRLSWLLLAIVLPAALPAQENSDQPKVIRRADGGASGAMESIFVAPKPGAPFSFTLHAEWIRPIGNGGTMTLVNQRHIVRDSRGRIYQERWMLVPKDGDVKSVMTTIQITDPEQHTWYNCIVSTKVCDLFFYRLSATDTFVPYTAPTAQAPNGASKHEHEDLGAGSSEGEVTHGYRETTTIQPRILGNDKPMVITREFWWSPRLAVNLLSTVDNPLTGKQIFTAKDLSISEPDPSYFQVPADYKVIDRREDESKE